jgi:hypothetical protein
LNILQALRQLLHQQKYHRGVLPTYLANDGDYVDIDLSMEGMTFRQSPMMHGD